MWLNAKQTLISNEKKKMIKKIKQTAVGEEKKKTKIKQKTKQNDNTCGFRF